MNDLFSILIVSIQDHRENLVGNAGFEPAASSSGGWRSIQLS